MQLVTPVWGDLAAGSVYEPSEDTFLLLDAVERDEAAVAALRPSVCLEVGSGAGIIITALSRALGQSAVCLALDINASACTATQNTANTNNAHVEVIRSDLVDGLRLTSSVDLLLFNPPYVVTPSDEIAGTSLERAWAGGISGRQVMDRLFPILPALMSQHSLCYIVVIEENRPEEIKALIETLGFSVKTIAQRKVRGERLSIMRFGKGVV